MPDEALNFVPAAEQPFADAPVKEDRQAEAQDVEPDAIDEPQPVDPADVEDAETGEPDQPDDPESAEPAEELEDFELDGQTITGPKGLKDRVMMHDDYTRKTQEVADRKRELDTIEQSLRQRAEATDEEMELRAATWAQDAYVKQYENIDWRAWIEQDPIAAQQAQVQYNDLIRQRDEGQKKLNEFANQRSQDAQQDFAKRVGETREFAQKNISGFTPEVEKRVVDFALEQGLSPAELQSNLNPVVFDLLHKAMIGAETLKNPAAPRTKAVPLKQVSSRSNAPVRKDLGTMNMEEYVKARAAQGYESGR